MQSRVFTVDIVSQKTIPEFLKQLENDVWLYRGRLNWELGVQERERTSNRGGDDYL